MDWIADPTIWISLLTLTALEIVLGVDNLVFLAILVDRLPPAQRPLGRKVGLGLALITRLMLLSGLAWIAGLTQPVFSLLGHAPSWRDIVLIGGGLFLLAKSTHEIHGSLEGEEERHVAAAGRGLFVAVVIQIAIIDIVFSLDSVITAVGMVRQLPVMAAAIVIAMIVMLVAAGPLSDFIARHPTVKMLALSFLLLIGMALVADGLGFYIPKGYLYFAMAFSVLVETLNLAARRRRAKAVVQLRTPLS